MDCYYSSLYLFIQRSINGFLCKITVLLYFFINYCYSFFLILTTIDTMWMSFSNYKYSNLCDRIQWEQELTPIIRFNEKYQ